MGEGNSSSRCGVIDSVDNWKVCIWFRRFEALVLHVESTIGVETSRVCPVVLEQYTVLGENGCLHHCHLERVKS